MADPTIPQTTGNVAAQVERLRALCAAAAEFLEKPALFRLRVQGEMMTREQVLAAIRETSA